MKAPIVMIANVLAHMHTHNKAWAVLIALGWIGVVVTAFATDGFQHPPTWNDLWILQHEDMAR